MMQGQEEGDEMSATALERANQAVERAEEASRTTDAVVRQSMLALASVRMWREENHFAEKLRRLIQGDPGR